MRPRIDPRIEDPRLAPVLRRLRELPRELQPPFDWIELRRRADGALNPAAWVLGWRHATAAACVTLMLVAFALWIRFEPPGDAAQVARTAPDATNRSSADAHWHRPDVAAGWLEALPAEPAIVRVDTRLAVTDLEDSIAWVDELLTQERASAGQPARVMALQRERSRLVDSLARVRYAETLAAELP